MTLLFSANRSNIGRVRHLNEDQSWVGRLASGVTLAIVADGMGGHQAGDVASEMAVNAFRNALERHADKTELSEDEGKMLIRQAIGEANEAIYATASSNERYHNMGTTIVAALLRDSQAVIGHVGDSRAYRITKEAIELLTMDHSLVSELMRSGQLTEEEAARHPRRNVLTRAVGTDAHVEIDVQALSLAPGDVLLLCSDGLTNMVSERQMHDTVSSEEMAIEAKADHLIELALEAGGDDNVTVVLLQADAGAEREEGSQ
ncbi:Stp1/IreP family PP2C-type Ser/Thr phosphatase [Paenibacillus sp. GCM10027627]|uniref:Stp1/IreP family PP2C-type Ser/Thr phosphatase n=1 Tax=unclassified Paenibacillus TaxID=185978 RepID=UPI00362D65BB